MTDANDVRDAEVPRGHGERILVVEDDDTVRQLVVDVLREWGYQQLGASDARTAIPILHSKRRIDLLVEGEEIRRRLVEYSPPPTPRRGYKALYAQSVTQAPEGCDFDFLTGQGGEQ